MVSMSDGAPKLQTSKRACCIMWRWMGTGPGRNAAAAAGRERDEWLNVPAILLFQRLLYTADRMEYVLEKCKKKNLPKRESPPETERERKPSLT